MFLNFLKIWNVCTNSVWSQVSEFENFSEKDRDMKKKRDTYVREEKYFISQSNDENQVIEPSTKQYNKMMLIP